MREAYETWVAEDYMQHNPNATDGRDAAIAFLEPFYQRNPIHRTTVYRVLVRRRSVRGPLARPRRARRSAARRRSTSSRVKDCKIVEHWDVTQAVPEKSANENGMF